MACRDIGKRKKYLKRYYENNKKLFIERKRQWDIDNPEKHKKYMREYCVKNKEKVKEWRKKYCEKNAEKNKQNKREWQKNYPEKMKAYMKKYKQSEKGKKVRRRGLYKSYGLTLEQYDQIFERQNGVCAICGKSETVKHQSGATRRLCIDHCHQSKKVRGLLCTKCNFIVGFANDSVEILANVIKYLSRND